MKRATANRHAIHAAAYMGMQLQQAMAQKEDAAMLVMVLYALGYAEKQVRALLQEHGIPQERDYLDIALHQYRTDTQRRRQYRQIIDQLNQEDEPMQGRKGRSTAGAGKTAEEGDPAGMGLVAGERAPRGVRCPPKGAPRKGAAPASAAGPHKQHSRR